MTETDRSPRINDTMIIHLNKDKDGKKYGKDHNPTRVGSAVHARFAKYVDGMTVAQAKAAGITLGDIRYHAEEGSHHYVTLKADPKAEAAAQKIKDDEAKAKEAKKAEVVKVKEAEAAKKDDAAKKPDAKPVGAAKAA